MIKRKDLRVLVLCLTTAFASLGVSALTSRAQEQQRKLEASDIIDTGGGMSAKILRCRGAGDDEECEVQYYRGSALESTPRWETMLFLRTTQERIQNYKKQQTQEQPRAANINRDDETKETEGNEKITSECSFSAPGGDASNTAKPSEELFKRKIFDGYNIIANGTGSAPLRVGVTFLSFQVSKPFINIVRVDPARGAQRINDAAPVNATIYPVKSEHIVCEQYRNQTLRKRVANTYACFKNRDGAWVCGADGIPKITQLN